MPALLIIFLWLGAAVPHLADRLGLNHVSGAWLALGDLAARGTLYPPLVEESGLGGTRFMGVPILIQAALAWALGSPILAGKLANLLVTAGLCTGVFACAVRLKVRTPVAAVLSSVILLTGPGWLSGTTVRYDALAVGLQVWALFVVVGRVGALPTRACVVIGVLCAMAFLSKLSAVWGGVGIGLALLAVERRAGLIVIASGMATAVGGLAALHALSDGRLWENILGLSFAGSPDGSFVWSLARGGKRYLIEILRAAPLIVCVAPLALAGALGASRRAWLDPDLRRTSVCVWASLGVGVGVAVLAFRDAGVASNHLLDTVALALVGACMSRGRFAVGALAPAAVLGAALWVWPLAGHRTIGQALADGRLRDEGRLSSTPLADRFDESSRLLSEDPIVPLQLGVDVVMLDAFMALRIDRRRPGALERIAERVRSREFDGVVLLRPIHDPFSPDWYSVMQVGDQIINAVDESYRFVGIEDGYAVYVPIDGSDERRDRDPQQPADEDEGQQGE